MLSLVLWSSVSPSRLADDLIQRGCQVWEALSLSEVLQLCETEERIDCVVISAGVDPEKAAVVKKRFMTLQLAEHSSAEDVLWAVAGNRAGSELIQ